RRAPAVPARRRAGATAPARLDEPGIPAAARMRSNGGEVGPGGRFWLDAMTDLGFGDLQTAREYLPAAQTIPQGDMYIKKKEATIRARRSVECEAEAIAAEPPGDASPYASTRFGSSSA